MLREPGAGDAVSAGPQFELEKAAIARLGVELQRSIREGDGAPVESDDALNDASRALVAAIAEEHGGAWLGKMQPEGEPVLRRWDGADVENFGANFVLPDGEGRILKNRVVVKLVLDRTLAPYLGTKEDLVRVTAIQRAVADAGGHFLFWS